MPFKTNYGQERAQRTRSREAKQQEKLARREEASARRKALREGETGGEPVDSLAGTDEPAKPVGE